MQAHHPWHHPRMAAIRLMVTLTGLLCLVMSAVRFSKVCYCHVPSPFHCHLKLIFIQQVNLSA